MPDEKDSPTRPDTPRSKSQEFAIDAAEIRLEGEVRVALAPGGSGMIPAILGEELLRILAVYKILAREVLLCVEPCGKCDKPATKRHVAAKWCDEHAPVEASDLPHARALRRAWRI